MTVTPLRDAAVFAAPDVPAVGRAVDGSTHSDAAGFADAVGRALDAAGASLRSADAAERAFAGGSGGLQEMVLERARADVALSIASAAASRAAQALSTILGMQV